MPIQARYKLHVPDRVLVSLSHLRILLWALPPIEMLQLTEHRAQGRSHQHEWFGLLNVFPGSLYVFEDIKVVTGG